MAAQAKVEQATSDHVIAQPNGVSAIARRQEGFYFGVLENLGQCHSTPIRNSWLGYRQCGSRVSQQGTVPKVAA
jgi:hypothetical protein